MAWDFSTDPEFEEQLDWMRAFVREEIWPLETVVAELEPDGARPHLRAAAGAGQGAAACGPRTCRPSSAGRASARSSSA